MAHHPDDEARIARLEADNSRLRRLLDERDALGALRHRLRNMVAMLRVIIRRSAETERDLGDYVGHLEDRLDALVRAQVAVDEQGSVDLHNLLANELLHYGASEGERVVLRGPVVCLQPRAGQVLAIAAHELAVNAIEHGALGGGAGHLDVTWDVTDTEAGPRLSLVWTERHGEPVAMPTRQGFGTEVLTQTLRYELDADVDLSFGPEGLTCTISFPMSDEVGRRVVI